MTSCCSLRIGEEVLTWHLNFLQKMFAEFELQGISEDVLNFKNYQTVQNRMRLEEATAAVSDASSASRSPRSAMGMIEKARKLALS